MLSPITISPADRSRDSASCENGIRYSAVQPSESMRVAQSHTPFHAASYTMSLDHVPST